MKAGFYFAVMTGDFREPLNKPETGHFLCCPENKPQTPAMKSVDGMPGFPGLPGMKGDVDPRGSPGEAGPSGTKGDRGVPDFFSGLQGPLV